MAFQGSLSELPLPDILQLVAVSGKTGSFSIENDRDTGQIYLSEGQIVHAQAGRLSGEEAIYELAIWPRGEFVFQPGEISVPTSIQKSNTSLLMEAARRMDEWRLLAKRIPSTSLVPVFTEEGGKTTVSLNPQEWAVVRKMDERRTIDEIAEALDSSPFEISKVVYGLIGNGLVGLADDSGRLDLQRLDDLADGELREIGEAVRRLALERLAGHAGADEVGERLGESLSEENGALDAQRVSELVREAERSISSALGPNRAAAFVESVEELLGERTS